MSDMALDNAVCWVPLPIDMDQPLDFDGPVAIHGLAETRAQFALVGTLLLVLFAFMLLVLATETKRWPDVQRRLLRRQPPIQLAPVSPALYARRRLRDRPASHSTLLSALDAETGMIKFDSLLSRIRPRGL